MGNLLKTVGKAAWKVVRSPQFRELLIGFLAKKLEEQQARERPSEG